MLLTEKKKKQQKTKQTNIFFMLYMKVLSLMYCLYCTVSIDCYSFKSSFGTKGQLFSSEMYALIWKRLRCRDDVYLPGFLI